MLGDGPYREKEHSGLLPYLRSTALWCGYGDPQGELFLCFIESMVSYTMTVSMKMNSDIWTEYIHNILKLKKKLFFLCDVSNTCSL